MRLAGCTHAQEGVGAAGCASRAHPHPRRTCEKLQDDAKVGRGARTEPKTSLNKGQKEKKNNRLAAHQCLLFPGAVFSLEALTNSSPRRACRSESRSPRAAARAGESSFPVLPSEDVSAVIWRG